MDPELASFVLKFQQLNFNGRNAKLLFKSFNGKVSLNLSVDIGSPMPPMEEIPYSVSTPNSTFEKKFKSRKSPSKQRRREKREESRRLFAEKAELELSVEEREVLTIADNLCSNHENGVAATDEAILEKDDAGKNENDQAEKTEFEELSRDRTADVDGAAEEAGYTIFDVTVDAHEKCCDSDVIEAIQENFLVL